MADLATLQARKAELEGIRASGVQRTRYGETDTTFRTDSEISAAIADIDRQILDASGSRRIRQVRVYNRSGL